MSGRSLFTVFANDKCPLYAIGDEFVLAGRSLALQGKPACLTLMDDIMQTVESHLNPIKTKGDVPAEMFSCSGQFTGCVGSIRLRYHRETVRSAQAKMKMEHEIAAIAGKLSNFSIFKSLSDADIKEIISHFRIQQFSKGESVLKKGEPGVKLFIILSGQVEIIGDYGVSIATLGKGDVFGEMSLLSGRPVNSTVRVLDDARIMFMNGNHFRMMLNRFPALQMYFARLMVDRLARSNEERAQHFASGIAGNFSEITPAELFQTLNMTEKTGVLNLNLADGRARLSFRAGDVVTAEYMSLKGVDAFYEIVKQVRGNFKFEPDLPGEEKEAPVLGDFMYLLMEALNRVDQESFRAR
jgi:CRP/FNR family transcriptional regulator, cyclic AMP receptor protein